MRSTVQETVAEESKTAKWVNCEGKYLSVIVIECCNVCNRSATKLRLCFLIVPVLCCGNRSGRDTLRNRGRLGDDNVNGKVERVGKGSSGAVGV